MNSHLLADIIMYTLGLVGSIFMILILASGEPILYRHRRRVSFDAPDPGLPPTRPHHMFNCELPKGSMQDLPRPTTSRPKGSPRPLRASPVKPCHNCHCGGRCKK